MRRRFSLAVIGLMMGLCLLAGCGGVTKKDAVGTYKLVYQPGPNTILGVETLVLKEDWTFVQSFKPTRGNGWKSNGRWHIEDQDTIFFEHRLMPIEDSSHVISPPKTEGGIYPIWKSGSKLKIEINPDIPYEYVKVK